MLFKLRWKKRPGRPDESGLLAAGKTDLSRGLAYGPHTLSG